MYIYTRIYIKQKSAANSAIVVLVFGTLYSLDIDYFILKQEFCENLLLNLNNKA